MNFTIPLFTPPYSPVVKWENLFSSEELDKINEMFEFLEFKQGKTGIYIDPNATQDTSIRDSNILFLEPDRSNEWIYHRIVGLISKVNFENFRLKIYSMQPLQFTKYNNDQHYTWHMDSWINGSPEDRKLSISICLSNKKDFEGGEFQIVTGGNIHKPLTIDLDRGDAVIFPSFLPHQVTKVTNGERRSVVGWCVGERYV